MARNKTVADKVANNDGVADRPSKMLTPETLVEVGKKLNARKASAAHKTFIPKENDGWKEQERLWPEASEEKRKNMLYQMIVWDGFVMGTKNIMKRLANYFGIDAKELKPYERIMLMADEARVAKVDENVFEGYLLNDSASGGKYHINNTYAYKVQNPAWEGVDTVASTPPAIVYVEAPKPDPKVREEVEAAIARKIAAMPNATTH